MDQGSPPSPRRSLLTVSGTPPKNLTKSAKICQNLGLETFAALGLLQISSKS